VRPSESWELSPAGCSGRGGLPASPIAQERARPPLPCHWIGDLPPGHDEAGSVGLGVRAGSFSRRATLGDWLPRLVCPVSLLLAASMAPEASAGRRHPSSARRLRGKPGACGRDAPPGESAGERNLRTQWLVLWNRPCPHIFFEVGVCARDGRTVWIEAK